MIAISGKYGNLVQELMAEYEPAEPVEPTPVIYHGHHYVEDEINRCGICRLSQN